MNTFQRNNRFCSRCLECCCFLQPSFGERLFYRSDAAPPPGLFWIYMAAARFLAASFES